jgi:hypothetical protein
MDRLIAAVTDRDISVLARIDHAEAVAKVEMTLRPTEVFIFGNPRVGPYAADAGTTDNWLRSAAQNPGLGGRGGARLGSPTASRHGWRPLVRMAAPGAQRPILHGRRSGRVAPFGTFENPLTPSNIRHSVAM